MDTERRQIETCFEERMQPGVLSLFYLAKMSPPTVHRGSCAVPLWCLLGGELHLSSAYIYMWTHNTSGDSLGEVRLGGHSRF